MRMHGLGAILVLGVLAYACAPPTPPAPQPAPRPLTPASPTLLAPAPGPSPTPFQPLPALSSGGAPTTSPRETSLAIWVPPFLPSMFKEALSQAAFLVPVGRPERAVLRLAVGDAAPVAHLVYALVAPFPTLEDGVTAAEVRSAWVGQAQGPFAGRPLRMAEATRAVLSAWWGAPAEGAVALSSPDELLDRAWAQRPSWAIVPFEALEPRWKVLTVDGLSPLHKDFDPQAYALTVPVSLEGDQPLVATLLSLYGPQTSQPLFPASNRDPQRMTTLVMTGVTALVRATAWTMEIRGLTYPARDIGPWLRAADITHISNEVPFAPNCPPPDPGQQDLIFCSDPRYIALLEDVGTDVVELTGDHFQDWGVDAMVYTLEQYRERGWLVYGGGENLEAARQAITLEHHGTRLAFIGCNAKGRPFAGATASLPGAAPCDFDWMHAEIARLRAEGYLPIVTFQHFEYYTYAALPNQVADFGGMAAAGAAIVSGSQAHHPQALAFQDGAFIHYGLGNLFFDQLDVAPGTRLAFIDRHVFYGGRHISTELLTIVFEDYARARPMTPAERRSLLQAVFTASGW